MNINKFRFLLAPMILSITLSSVGCRNPEQVDDGPSGHFSSEELTELEEQIFELYNLAPCPPSRGYCSSSFLIRDVDDLVSGYCRAGRPEEAYRIYAFFEHFTEPSPQPPEC